MDANEVADLGSAVFAPAPQVSWRDAPGELALFDARAETYHVLNPSAAGIWRLLAAGSSPDEAVAELCERFEADPEQVAADVRELVVSLLERGLLVRQ